MQAKSRIRGEPQWRAFGVDSAKWEGWSRRRRLEQPDAAAPAPPGPPKGSVPPVAPRRIVQPQPGPRRVAASRAPCRIRGPCRPWITSWRLLQVNDFSIYVGTSAGAVVAPSWRNGRVAGEVGGAINPQHRQPPELQAGGHRGASTAGDQGPPSQALRMIPPLFRFYRRNTAALLPGALLYALEKICRPHLQLQKYQPTPAGC